MLCQRCVLSPQLDFPATLELGSIYNDRNQVSGQWLPGDKARRVELGGKEAL